jgi:AraC-like DNA-binding protein
MNNKWLNLISPYPNLAGQAPERPNWTDPKRVIYDHELMFFGEGGHFQIEIGGTMHDFRGSSFIIIPPGAWHVCRGIVCKGILRAYVHFDWVFRENNGAPILTYAPAHSLDHLFRKAPKWVPHQILEGPVRNPTLAFEIHKRLSEQLNRGTALEKARSRTLLLELLLLFLWPDQEEKTHNLDRQSADLAVRTREALNLFALQPFSTSPRIREYLNRLGKSYDHQARIFRATYGVSPLTYVNLIRMEHAENLLRDTGLTVNEIARRLGFSDVVYFIRLYKKLTGTTPGAHRTRIGNRQEN